MKKKFNRYSVLIVIDEWNHPAGTELYVCDLVKGLEAKGCSVTLCVLPNAKGVPPSGSVFCVAEFIEVVYLVAWNDLTDLIKNNSYDIVHNHLFSSLLKAVWYERKVELRPKIVNTWHLSLSAWGYKVYLMWLASIFYSDTTVGVAKHVFLTKFGFDLLSLFKGKCRFVYHCPKISNVTGMAAKLDKFIVCGCGRLSKEKNWITLLKAVNHIKQMDDGAIDIEVVLLGDGPERGKLEAYVKKHALGSVIKFKGRVSPEQVYNYMRNSGVVVLPSEHEAFPLVIVEAMALGVCVLASDIPVTREIFGDEFELNTFIVGDYEELAKKLMRIISNASMHESCVEASKNKHQQICAIDMAEFYRDIYGE